MLDAAYNHPFAKDGQPLAGGLALMEPEPKGLIAFNAAPGTIAPTPTGNYGPYAQALAEMIRTGGIGLPEVFNRVRLRVNDVTKGAEVPWDANKLDGEFLFFERAPDAPPVQADQDASQRSKPIRDFSAQDAYTAALERDTIADYEAFLAAYPDDPMAKRVRAIVAARREAITWRQTYRANTQQSYWSYLKRYPKGPHAADARRRLANIAAALEPPPAFDAYAYDVPPPQDYEYEYIDRPYLMFDDPAFGFAPPPPPPIFFLPPVPDDFVSLDAPIYYDDPYYLPQPVFIPIPVFIRPPVFVRPPINRFLFNNIHNREVISNIINRRPPSAGGTGPGGQLRPGRGGPGAAATVRPAFAPTLPASAARRGNLIRQGRVSAPAGVLPGAAGRGRPGQNQQPGDAARPGNLPAANVLPGQTPAGRPGARPLPMHCRPPARQDRNPDRATGRDDSTARRAEGRVSHGHPCSREPTRPQDRWLDRVVRSGRPLSLARKSSGQPLPRGRRWLRARRLSGPSSSGLNSSARRRHRVRRWRHGPRWPLGLKWHPGHRWLRRHGRKWRQDRRWPRVRLRRHGRLRHPGPHRRGRSSRRVRGIALARSPSKPAASGRKIGRICLLNHGRVGISRASHTEAWLSKAVRWQPGQRHLSLASTCSHASERNQPEN